MTYCIKTIANIYKKGVMISSEEIRREEFDFETEDKAISYCTNTYDLDEFVKKALKSGEVQLGAAGEDRKFYTMLVEIVPAGEKAIADFEALGVWESEMSKELEDES